MIVQYFTKGDQEMSTNMNVVTIRKRAKYLVKQWRAEARRTNSRDLNRAASQLRKLILDGDDTEQA